MIVGRIVSGRYVRVTDEHGAPTKAPYACVDDGGDYYKGVAPSDLARLDNRQLYLAAERLHESVAYGVGTPREVACAQEALAACYTERRRRRATLR